MQNNDDALWRDEAVNRSLEHEMESAAPLGVLLHAIRTHRGPCATGVLWLDRQRISRFLAGGPVRATSLLRGTIRHYGRGELSAEEGGPLVAWHEVRWQESALEVVLPPGTGHGYAVCVAQDEATLNRFVQALADFTVHPVGRCLRFSGGWKSAPDMDAEIGKVTWDDIVLPPDTLTDLRHAVEGFFANRAMFDDLGFAWRRGVLLVGPPGTGKTMVCKAAAAALPDLPFLYVRDLRGLRGQEPIRSIFERARKLAPCILAFEDLDGFVNEANRALFLNELDGFQNNQGLLIIASSNHPGRIDEALLKRPSRFDRVFHLGLPGPAEREEFCRRILARSTLAARLSPALDVSTLARQAAERSDGFTPAYLKEAFVSAALQHAQQGAAVLDERFAASVLEQIAELRQHLQRMRDPESLGEIRTSETIGLRR